MLWYSTSHFSNYCHLMFNRLFCHLLLIRSSLCNHQPGYFRFELTIFWLMTEFHAQTEFHCYVLKCNKIPLLVKTDFLRFALRMESHFESLKIYESVGSIRLVTNSEHLIIQYLYILELWLVYREPDYSINTHSVDWFNPKYLCIRWSDSWGVFGMGIRMKKKIEL